MSTKDNLEEFAQKNSTDGAKDCFLANTSGCNGIKTMVMFTVDSLDSSSTTDKVRNSLLKEIKDGGYACIPAFDGIAEYSFAVFNMSVETAKTLMGKYQQASFVYVLLLEDNVHNELWKKMDPSLPYNKHNNGYVVAEDTIEDRSSVNDGYVIIGKSFRYSISAGILNECQELFNKNLKHIVEHQKQNGVILSEDKVLDYTINKVGQSPYLWRKAVINDFYKK